MLEEPINITTNQPEKNEEAYKAILQLGQQKQDIKEKENYWKAYVMSILLPPAGVYYFIRYFFFGGEQQGKRRAAVISLVLTIISLFLNIWLIQLFLNQSLPGGSQNLDTLRELITPENQKSLQQLLQ